MAWENTEVVRKAAQNQFNQAREMLEDLHGSQAVTERLEGAGQAGIYPGDVDDLMGLFAGAGASNVVSIASARNNQAVAQQEQETTTTTQYG